jgi:hypothetical protein
MVGPLIPTDAEVEARLRQWAEITALSLKLLEASIKWEFPNLSESEVRDKMVERLDTFRRLKWCGNAEHSSGAGPDGWR